MGAASWDVSGRGMRFVSGEVASAAFSAWVKGAKGDRNAFLPTWAEQKLGEPMSSQQSILGSQPG